MDERAQPPAKTGVEICSLPSAWARWDELAAALRVSAPALFLDYDGTLTPIVERPEDAHLPVAMRGVLARLARSCAVFVVSGRDVSFIVREVGLDDVWYLGSHGFDVVAPTGAVGTIGREREFEGFVQALDEAEERLRARLAGIAGAEVERKKYAVAVHYRRVVPRQVPLVEEGVREVLLASPGLRMSGGKRVFELRPDVDWDKGRAVLWALETMESDGARRLPIYVGDDLTDEDAFAALPARAYGVVVGGGERLTRAGSRLPDPDALRLFLASIAGILEEEAGPR